jgi:chemosensory pili system protein ChpA (sensor histidine kinase/response regulator)
MNAATEFDQAQAFDVGPLTWVKSEIDLALERADQTLQQYTASTGDLTQLKFCRTHLHQVQGALTIVGLDGVTQLAEALESLLEAIEQQQRPADAATITLAQRALAAIRHYLDDLISGHPNQPLRLLPIYREVQTARGLERISATDLFFPDLTVRPPPRTSGTPPIERSEIPNVLHQARVRFQRGLLMWLRATGDRAGVDEMLSAVTAIEATQDLSSARSFWWVTSGFLAALADGALAVDTDVKQQCGRIDLQIRRLLEGSKNVAERLLRDTLYFVASADSDHALVQQIKTAYQLQAIMPGAESAAPAPQDALRRRLRDVILATEEAWNKFCAGTAQALPLFKEHCTTLSATVEQLGQTDYRRLAQAVASAANWLAEKPSRHSESLAMEIATAILLTHNAQENFQRLGADFAHQVDVMVARIHGCIAENPPLPGSEVPELDEMSRQAQEKLLIGQVAKEIQSNLAQIEQVLDGFFRDAEKRADLNTLEVPLHQVIGALTMIRNDGSIAALQQCAADIRNFAAPTYVPLEADFERVADQLSIVGFFIDALQHGATDFDSFVRQMQSAPNEKPAAEVSAEAEPADQAAAAIEASPEVVEPAEPETAASKPVEPPLTLSVPEASEASAAIIDDEIIVPAKPIPAAPQPSAATIQLAKSSAEEIDAELLEIFLEEAHDVLNTIGEQIVLLKAQPHNIDFLTILRRAFHTLKGSGRMVGLKDLGEVAWSVEQVLNLWLRQELEVTPPFLDLLDQSHEIFTDWVAFLEHKSSATPDPRTLVTLAESLRLGDDELPEIARPAALPVPEAVADLPETIEEVEKEIEAEVEAETEIEPAAESSETEELDFELDLPAEAPAPAPEPEPEPEPEPAEVEESAEPVAGLSSALHEIFLEEARNHLVTLQRECKTLEADLTLPTSHELYRAAHTLGGIAGTVGLAGINHLGLALEHALLRRDQASHPASLETFVVLQQAIAELEVMLYMVAEGCTPEGVPALVDALNGIYPTPLIESAAEAVTPDKADKTGDEATASAESAIAALPVSVPAEPATKPAAPEAPLLQDELDEQLLPLFLEEALDLNENITKQLRAWRTNPADVAAMRTLLRHLHTLKGSARMAGAMSLGEIAHAIETRVEAAHRTGSAPPELIDEVDNAYDAVIQIVDRLQNGEAFDLPVSKPEEVATAATATGKNTPEVSTAAVPESVVNASNRRQENRQAEDVEPDPEAGTPRAMLRVRADLIDRLVNEAGELSIARARIEGEMRGLKSSLLDLTENVIRLRRQLRDIEIQAESQMQSRTAIADERHAGFDPLEIDRFTRFQELTRMMAESVNDVATVQQNLLKNLDDANAAILAQARLNREVQQALMSVRMVPFASVADRLYRIVRQTGKELGKRANLEIRGGQVEIDRSVLEKMGAPLEHLLRNAIAHGLEARETRLAQGKPEIGEITLTLAQEGNEIILSFSDDGAGLDFERIHRRGITAGLIAEDEEIDNDRLVDLIFMPGVSTATELSQIAGRGIGLDIVKTEVTSLGGRIELVSAPGTGTTFRLYIPLTLAVTQALLVRTGNRTYAIPSVMIEQVLDLKEAELAGIRDAGVAEWMGNKFPFNFLPHLLGETQALPEMRRKYWVLLLRSGKQRIAVQVDELKGNQEIVVKNIGPQLARVIGIDGATVLGNGQVVLILNPVALTSRAPTVAFAAPIPTLQKPSGNNEPLVALPTVMVVDDSLTVRKITGRLLAREGYQVFTAKDGVDALEQLLDVLPDVLLVDIEMPRMDGFDFTRNVRADARLKDIPIIMITSRTADKHRSYAKEIGVNQYLGKPYQEEELLGLIADYIKAK